MRKYRAAKPYTKAEAEVIFAQGTSEQIADALLGVTYYVEDWRWVQSACLAFLDSSDAHTQKMAIICLGHLATFHKTLDLSIVLPALQAHESDPELAAVLYDTFGDIASKIIRNAPELVSDWDNLPQGLQRALIEDRVFDDHGKLI